MLECDCVYCLNCKIDEGLKDWTYNVSFKLDFSLPSLFSLCLLASSFSLLEIYTDSLSLSFACVQYTHGSAYITLFVSQPVIFSPGEKEVEKKQNYG